MGNSLKKTVRDWMCRHTYSEIADHICGLHDALAAKDAEIERAAAAIRATDQEGWLDPDDPADAIRKLHATCVRLRDNLRAAAKGDSMVDVLERENARRCDEVVEAEAEIERLRVELARRCPECDGTGEVTWPDASCGRGGYAPQAITSAPCRRCTATLTRERDEARAEVERLRGALEDARRAYPSDARLLVASTALWWYAHRGASNEGELYEEFLAAVRAARREATDGE